MTNAFATAQRLLARREHGAEELRSKLLQKGHDASEIEAVIAECQRLGLQCDTRFSASFCRTRVRQGYGPLRIRQELQGKQINADLVEKALCDAEHDWPSCAKAVWLKKFKGQKPCDFAKMQKQKQFMYYRGFSPDIIEQVIGEL